MTESAVHNQDCLEAMRKMPDNAFDLAVVDPPYGAGFTEGGGCKGWFTKYHQNAESEQGGAALEPIRRAVRQIQVDHLHSSRRAKPGRTGDTWAAKYAKKLLRGTPRRSRNILKNCSVSHEIR